MADLDKVLKALTHCCAMNGEDCRKCPYQNESIGSHPTCTAHLASDALELLKSQQAKIKKYELDKSWDDSPDRMNGCGW